MRRLILALAVLALGILACTKVTPTPNALGETATPTVEIPNATPFPTRTATPTETQFPTLAIVGNVWIREIPNGEIVGSLDAGTTTTGDCTGEWCHIPNGWIWRGCTSNNPNALGCEMREE